MVDQTKNILIGLFIVAAFSIVTFILLFLHPSMGDEGQVLHVRFTNIDKVNIGTRVLFAGHPVGEVVRIQEIPEAREHPDKDGKVYIFELTLKIDSGVEIFATDDISAKTSGLLGEKSIAITPEFAPKGTKLIKITDQVLFASSPETVEDVMRTVNDLSEKAGVFVDNANEFMNQIKKNELIDNLGAILSNVKSITDTLNVPDELTAIINNVKDITEWINKLKGDATGALDSFHHAMKDLDLAIISGKDWIGGLNDSAGTVYKLFHEEKLYLQLMSLMSKAETVVDDMSHYGLLYQNDKAWQRMRARRVNLLQKLQCPQEFRNFFNDEIDEITASLGRVAMVLDEGQRKNCFDVVFDPEFVEIFAELLRRVDTLEKNIKLYNQQVVDKRADCFYMGY